MRRRLRYRERSSFIVVSGKVMMSQYWCWQANSRLWMIGSSARTILLPTMGRKPVVLIVRDSVEWKSDEFVTLFGEEGYDTRDVNWESLSTAMDQREPFGVISIMSSRLMLTQRSRTWSLSLSNTVFKHQSQSLRTFEVSSSTIHLPILNSSRNLIS